MSGKWNWSNAVVDSTTKEQRQKLEAALAELRKRPLRLPAPERLILPPDWETSLSQEVVAEIKRRLGR